MALADAQVRNAIRAQLQFLLKTWDTQDISFERASDNAGVLYRSRGDVPDVPGGTHLVAAFFVVEREEDAQAWYDALLAPD